MVKLSELTMSTPLALYCPEYGDLRIMTKEDFLQSELFWNHFASRRNRISLVEQTCKRIDLFRVIELIHEDVMCDGCTEGIYNDLKDAPEATAFVELVNDFFQRHPTYREKESVEIDILPWGAPVNKPLEEA